MKKLILSISILFVLIAPINLLSQNFWQETVDYYGSEGGPSKFVQDNDGIIYGTYGSKAWMIRSDDEGLTWTDIKSYLPPSPLGEHCTYSILCKDDIAFTHIHSGDNGSNIFVGHGVYRSYDHGLTWENVSAGFGADTNITYMYLLPNGNILAYYKGDYTGRIYISTDNGDTWNMTYDLSPHDKDALWSDGTNGVYFLWGSSLYKSSDYGMTWNQLSSTFETEPDERILFNSSGDILTRALYSTPGFIKSTDGGVNWTDCSNSMLQDDPYSYCISHGDTIYADVGSSGNPYNMKYSTDLAESWDSLDMSGVTSPEKKVYTMIITKSGYLLACFYFDGIYRSVQRVSADASGIKENIQGEINIDVFPNPANNKITIKGENIQKLEIFDINGKLTYKYNYNNEQEVHIYTEDWKDGVYSLKITTGKGVSFNKEIVIK